MRAQGDAAVAVLPDVEAAPDAAPSAVESPPACGDAGNVFVFVSPEHPVAGQPMRVVALADHLVDAQLSVATGTHAPTVTGERHGGPPYYWLAEIEAPSTGRWKASLARDAACAAASTPPASSAPLATKDIVVFAHRFGKPETPRTSLWFTHAAWSPSLENVYSAWIEHLFDAPLDAQPSWSALHEVLRDPSRNLLFNHLGIREDEQNVVIRPDCADLPYFLRAYFSFKLGLPFGWSHCSRGENGVAPTCKDKEYATTSDPFPPIEDKPPTIPAWADPDRDKSGPWEDNVKRLGEFLRTTLADGVQSGAGRTMPTDDESDYYPVSLSVETLRPGTIFADPYGHFLVIAKRIPQTPTSGGVLLAVDGQPDGTVARKRFWRGNFLFAIDPTLGGAGFKRFRPVVRDGPEYKPRHRKNAELKDYSATDQYTSGVEGFYDKVEDVLSPAPLDPMQALLETIQALEEQVKTRVLSVDNGRKFIAAGKASAEMPDGAKIFETTGDWEDFSTPSRDLRLLIAIDVARALPARVARRPERYSMPAGQSVEAVKAALEQRLARELRDRRFRYARSDGSDWGLSLQDVLDRQTALEMAYNPNDCVEQRWGAPAGSDELSTCRSHAPPAQMAKMETYRSWFHDRRRPPR
jgi:hypothetical protein